MRPARALRNLAAALACAGLLASCGGGGGDDDAAAPTTTEADVPAECVGPPVTVDLRAGGEPAAGDEAFEVTDAVARRVAILPGEMAFDPAALSGLESEASVTPLALYTLYLADFEIPTEELSGTGLGQITPGEGETVGALTMVPPTEAGFAEGNVVLDGEFDYETRTTFTPLSVTVFADGDTTPQAYTDVVGQAEILQLDEETICVDFDVTLESDGELVYRAKGVVLAPVVRAADAFFFT